MPKDPIDAIREELSIIREELRDVKAEIRRLADLELAPFVHDVFCTANPPGPVYRFREKKTYRNNKETKEDE